MKPIKIAATATAAAATLALLVGSAAPAAAVPETVLRPAELKRGPDIAVPHVEGRTVVDGDVRIKVEAARVHLLGPSGNDYVVGTSNADGSARFRVLRLTPSGGRTVLLRGVPIWELLLSGDGTQIAFPKAGRDSSRVRVFDATDGTTQADRTFRGSVSVLDLDEQRMVLGGWGPNRTFWWNTRSDATRRISGRTGYEASIRADRVASYTKDPYLGGCTVVTTLRGTEPLWRSCSQRVATFAPRGTRMATIHILSDGLGPRDVLLRKPHGKVLAHYSAQWFGALDWESDRKLLLDTNGTEKSATVRCVVADCERASDLRPVPNLRRTTAARS
ncbi:hypothetical protein GCM10009844_25630 [Nocardioides koreensis]|uniref:WD40 repeat domain-containing protein n=1 Tax=Nocardioides koreensis TaxID=433651 RepID=A0ABP5LLF7_9ACTN